MKNTLHICNYTDTLEIDIYKNLIDNDDSLLFYAQSMSTIQAQQLYKDYQKHCKNIYFIIADNHDNIASINHANWLQLLNNHKKCMTWK
jgi:hypothetical protein